MTADRWGCHLNRFDLASIRTRCTCMYIWNHLKPAGSNTLDEDEGHVNPHGQISRPASLYKTVFNGFSLFYKILILHNIPVMLVHVDNERSFLFLREEYECYYTLDSQ